jgi:PhnB protein
MLTVNPYLNINRKAEEAFNFYKSVFGGEFTALKRYKDMSEGC